MSNMSYCRFINTRTDLNDCLDLLRHDERNHSQHCCPGLLMV
jgi:hypothetical protein